ncbi:MAG: hypothetical protein KME42_08940 [Tildeniella nuda ZEHNDER 1965/U140]|jgi:hypothetical protein|nr:hypothetical protein [Tildeniella nuda ZEHNDER 1965/U140]
MFSQSYYLIRSRADGSYLVAHPHADAKSKEEQRSSASFLLLFREHFDALSYLNTHASGVVDRFTVESIPGTQIDNLLKRWSFTGVGVVQDPLLPKVEFLSK